MSDGMSRQRKPNVGVGSFTFRRLRRVVRCLAFVRVALVGRCKLRCDRERRGRYYDAFLLLRLSASARLSAASATLG